MKTTIKVTGNIRMDKFGRIIIDKCPSDQEHFYAAALPGDDRARCRMVLDANLEQYVGEYGTLEIEVNLYD